MSASTYVGRIGALAAAFGVGAAILTGPAIAWADPASSDSSGPSDSAAGTQSAGTTDSTPNASRGQAARAARTARTARTPESSAPESSPSAGDPSSDSIAEELPAISTRDLTPRRTDSAESAPEQKTDSTPAPAAATAPKSNDAPAAASVATESVDVAPAVSPAIAPADSTAAPAPAAAQAVTSLIETAKAALATAPTVTATPAPPAITLPTALANVANRISTVVNSLVTQLVNTFSGTSPFAPQVDSPANWLLFAAARRQPLAAAATASATAATTTSPTLVLDGYNVVATSTEIVDSFTGRWAYWPGQPNMLQGRQDFNLVDPATSEVLGSFSALVTSGDPTSLGARYVQMLVTANDGTNVGTGAGQTPPVGSVISELSLAGFGFSYTAMPSESGDKVAVKIKTPLGSIPIPLTYDAAAGIADHTFDERPMGLANGYTIKPTSPATETITGSIGFLPLFNSLQGIQEFGVYDAQGNKVSSFTGNFTTTSDTLGISTQAIQVIANDGTNVGTGAGQTPPVGTVYNVAYFWSDNNFLIYSSMPKDSGDSAIALKFSSNGTVTDLGNLPLSLAAFSKFDASHEPAMKSLVAPGGQKFVPTSEVIYTGVNGLPPRDVQVQGYQQFDVYDALGRKIGTVDAQVENQWDAFGVHSKSILITDVTNGAAGASPFNIPPVGTVMNFVDFGTGLGFADSVIPLTAKINLNSWQLVTPIVNIPLLPSPWLNTAPAVDYFDPFV